MSSSGAAGSPAAVGLPVEAALADLARLYAPIWRPEKLVRALLLGFHSVHPERQLSERLDHHLLFRCFTGLAVSWPPVWTGRLA